MEARMKHPAMIVPEAMQALQSLGKTLHKEGATLPLELVHLRASQINGCSVCVDMHAKALKQSGETDERLFAVGAWREAPYFDDDERAALATFLVGEPEIVRLGRHRFSVDGREVDFRPVAEAAPEFLPWTLPG